MCPTATGRIARSTALVSTGTRGSILVTSNRDYSEWPEAFVDNPLLASAALDRLAHRAHRITITGPSYRAQDKPRPLRKTNGEDPKK